MTSPPAQSTGNVQPCSLNQLAVSAASYWEMVSKTAERDSIASTVFCSSPSCFLQKGHQEPLRKNSRTTAFLPL